MTEQIDIVDRLQDEEGFVRIVLTSGEVVFGMPLCIVYDEDEDGWETIKTIMVRPWFGLHNAFYRLEDIESYAPIAEEDIPPHE